MSDLTDAELWAMASSGAIVCRESGVLPTVHLDPAPFGHYRCSKGHRWDSVFIIHPLMCMEVAVDGDKVTLTADPCPFCYIEFHKALPQAEEVSDVPQSH